MAEQMKRDWIEPVLEDVRDFLRENDMAQMADEIDDMLRRHGPRLRADPVTGAGHDGGDGPPDNTVPFRRRSSRR